MATRWGRPWTLREIAASRRLTNSLAPPVYIVADEPCRQSLVDRLATRGIPTGSFDSDLDTPLARASGHTLIIAIVGDRLVLPERYWPGQTVISLADLRRRQGETASENPR